jgi:hypothetical protein
MTAALQADGPQCATIVVRQCYSTSLTAGSQAQVYINSNLIGATPPVVTGGDTASDDVTVYFTFNPGDELKIVDVGHTIVQVASLTFGCLQATTPTVVDPTSCSDGTVTVDVTNGVGPYTVVLRKTGATTPPLTLADVPAGSFTVSDNTDETIMLVYGQLSGTTVATVTTLELVNVPAGEYTVVIYDVGGKDTLELTSTVTLTEPDPLEAHAYTLDPVAGSCGMTGVLVGSTGGTYTSFLTGGSGQNGESCTSVQAGFTGAGDTVCCPSGLTTVGDGSACATPSCILYDLAQGSPCAPSAYGSGNYQVGVGEHTFTVTDDNGCSDTVTITIAPIPPLTATAVVSKAIACNGGTGAVTVTATGGVAPYTYSGGSTDGVYNDLSADAYT